jgi:hypothetical protein
LIDALSDGRERAERELDLQMALGPALYATKLASHPDVGRTYARARELCEQLGDHPREFTALRGLWLYHTNLLEMGPACHAGAGTRPIRKLHVRIEHLKAPPILRKRRLELPLVEEHRTERRVRPDETGRIVEPFGHTQRLLGKMLRLLPSRRSFPGCSVTRISPSMS